MYESGNQVDGVAEEFIEYVPGDQILEETVVDGLIDVDHIDTVMETADGYGYVNVKIDDSSYEHENGKRRYRMRQRTPAVTHYCVQCNKHIKYPSKIQEHIRKHTGEKPYLCAICGARFSQGHALKAHLLGHQGERPFKCSYCTRCFATIAHRNTHEKALHHEQAGLDEEPPEEKVNLQEHDTEPSTSETVPTNIFICPFEECGFQSHMREEVEEHLNVIHNCEVAQDDGTQEDHLWSEYPAEDGQPTDIGVNFHMYTLHDHMNGHLDSNLVDPGPSSLDQQQSLVDPQDVPPPSAEEEIDSSHQFGLGEQKVLTDSLVQHHHQMVDQYDPGYEGGYCNTKDTGLRMAYEDDGVYDTEDESVQVWVDPNPPKRGRQPEYSVPKTAIVMDARMIDMIRPKPETYRPRRAPAKPPRNLDWIIDAVAKGHDVDMSSPHNRKKPKIHRCEYCGKVDKYPSKILAHMRTHTGEKPYKCSICGMAFAQRTPMRLHMRRHLNEKPFVCPFDDCGESFVSGALRNQHVSKKHLKEKKYVCMKGCGRCFASSKNQRTHEARCFYNREDDIDPVYQQLLYDEEQEEEIYDQEGNLVQGGVDVKWDPMQLSAEEHHLAREDEERLIPADEMGGIYLEQS